MLLSVSEAAKDLAIAELWDAGTAGITEEPGGLRAFFQPASDSETLARTFARYEPRLRREEERDWVQEAHDRWQPFPVGERFYLAPEWRDDPAPCGRIRLPIYPGMASGTGDHPCTQLCLRALEELVGEDDVVLDIGAGSGILALAARLLGAVKVFGCDIDHASTQIAQANLRKSPFSIPLWTGSLRSVRPASVDLLVANLNAETLLQLAPEFARIRTVRSVLILSGFKEAEVSRLRSAFPGEVKDHLTMGDWVCLVL